MDLLKTRIDVGWTVYIYGKRTTRPTQPPLTFPAPVSL